jgi:predicted PurR-regulated permease PerM
MTTSGPTRPTPPAPRDLAGTTLAVLFIGGLIVASLWIIRPFLPAVVWAVTLVIATWPLMLRIQRYVGNRRAVAVMIMTVTLLLVLIVPVTLAVMTIVANVDEITELVRGLLSLRVPAPPDWVAQVPLVGASMARVWAQFTATGVHDLAPRLTPYAGEVTRWFVSAIGGIGVVLLQFLLVVAIAAGLYAGGEGAAAAALRFGRRLGNQRGEMAVRLAGQAIYGVALGVVVTALAQSVVGGIGLLLAGVPFAPVLTALVFMLCLAQIGPAPVLIPAIVWMYYASDALWASVLLLFSVVAMTMDNVLRPLLIRRGADLPLYLILAGVIGGLIAMGVLGIFLGPTILAVGYTLLSVWIAEADEPAAPE